MAVANPRALIIPILRDPAARAFGRFAQHRRDGLEPIGSFGTALEVEEQRFADGWSAFHGYLAGGRCGAIVERFDAAFGPEQVLILLHDDLETDPLGTWRRICDFLGLDPRHLPDFAARPNEASRRATGARSAMLLRLLAHGTPVTRAARHILPSGIRARIRTAPGRRNQGSAVAAEPAAMEHIRAATRGDVDWLKERPCRSRDAWR